MTVGAAGALTAGAGAMTIETRYHASFGDATFGDEVVYEHPGGDFPWTRIAADLHLPEDGDGPPNDPELHPRAVRLFIHHAPPRRGRGILSVDELALVSWQPAQDLATGLSLTAPHAFEFLRLNAAPGRYHLQLAFRALRPAVIP